MEQKPNRTSSQKISELLQGKCKHTLIMLDSSNIHSFSSSWHHYSVNWEKLHNFIVVFPSSCAETVTKFINVGKECYIPYYLNQSEIKPRLTTDCQTTRDAYNRARNICNISVDIAKKDMMTECVIS